MLPRWDLSDGGYGIDWCGRGWRLELAGSRPGLYAGDGTGPVLGLGPLLARGRRDEGAWAVGPREVDCRFNRVTATYEPPGWETLRVRAAWTPVGERVIELEVQVQAFTVGKLRAVEVLTLSQVSEPGEAAAEWLVTPRDARAAALTYDGRQAGLDRLLTLPLRGTGVTSGWPPLGAGAMRYLELAHPDDESRLIRDGAGACQSHALFGYDIEKGILLRGRVRGTWVSPADAEDRRSEDALLDDLLRAPLPLGT